VQGSFFMDKPHYDWHEQFVCAVKGNMNIVVIPHVNRKQVYGGEIDENSLYYEPIGEFSASPINFFMPKR
jgi:hypothetical protein